MCDYDICEVYFSFSVYSEFSHAFIKTHDADDDVYQIYGANMNNGKRQATMRMIQQWRKKNIQRNSISIIMSFTVNEKCYFFQNLYETNGSNGSKHHIR